jgi:glutamate synthase domain-containing protein 3
MDTLIVVLIAALAGSYLVELIGTLVERFTIWNANFISQLLSPFATAGAAVLLGQTGWELIPIGLAGGFIYIIVMKVLSRPVQIQQVVSSRRP